MAKKTTSDLPTKVKVGYRDYEIVNWPHMDAANTGRYGQTAHLTRKISVDISHGGRETASTLLHEIVHAVWRMTEIDQSGAPPKEEHVVSVIATGLCGVWRDNPEVMDFIGRNLVHGT